MNSHIVIDGNAFYEIDDDCVREKQEEEEMEMTEAGGAVKRTKEAGETGRT